MYECKTCVHKDVCKYQEQYENLTVETGLPNVELTCKYYETDIYKTKN